MRDTAEKRLTSRVGRPAQGVGIGGRLRNSEAGLDRAVRLIPQILEEKALAPALLAELLELSPVERERLIIAERRLQTYSLAVHALRHSARAITQSPLFALELAQIGQSIASRLDSDLCGGSAVRADLEAYALAMEGNALRVAGDKAQALEIFKAARRVQGKGGADPDLTARIDSLEASLRRDLRQVETALGLLDRAANLFRRLRDRSGLALNTINRSNVFLVKGDFDQALAILKSAQSLSHDPYVLLCIRHNSSDILARSGRPKEAARLLEQTRNLYHDHANPLMISQRLWLESIILRELGGDLELARELMMEATNQLVDRGYDASGARIELAVLREKGQSSGR